MKTAAMLSLAMGLTLSAGAAFAQEITLRSADIHPDGYPTVDAVKFMGDLVKERTNGRIAIQVMNNAALPHDNLRMLCLFKQRLRII